LIYIYNAIQNLKSQAPPSSEIETKSETVEDPIIGTDGQGDGDGLGRISVLSIGGMIGFLSWTGARRWKAGRVGKSSKFV